MIEHHRRILTLRHHPEVRRHRLPELLQRRIRRTGDRLQPRQERLGGFVHNLPKQLLFGGDVGVEAPSLQPDRRRDVPDGGAIVAALAEKPPRHPQDLLPSIPMTASSHFC